MFRILFSHLGFCLFQNIFSMWNYVFLFQCNFILFQDKFLYTEAHFLSLIIFYKPFVYICLHIYLLFLYFISTLFMIIFHQV